MIPLHKLIELPRTLRLRKAASLFGEAERRFIITKRLEPEKVEYLGRVAELLAKDEKFSNVATEALNNAGLSFASAAASDSEIRRSLNSVYNLLLAETGRSQADWDFIEASGSFDLSKRSFFPGMQVYFADIRSPFNVGSMFRAAESFGVEKIWLSPLCADPLHKRAMRSAMGCVDIIPWERLPSEPFARLDENGDIASLLSKYPLFALETGGTPLDDFHFPQKGILIAGSEELGVSPQALASADASLGRVSIPTWGIKGSLNVAVAFGIVIQVWAAKMAAVKQSLSIM